MAKPSASRLKLSRRSAGLLMSPTMCCTQMWKSANARTHGDRDDRQHGDARERARRARCPRSTTRHRGDASAGARRRDRRARPENTPSAIGSAAISETSTPTVSGVAPRESASSENVRRVPLYAVCVRMVTRTTSASGIVTHLTSSHSRTIAPSETVVTLGSGTRRDSVIAAATPRSSKPRTPSSIARKTYERGPSSAAMRASIGGWLAKSAMNEPLPAMPKALSACGSCARLDAAQAAQRRDHRARRAQQARRCGIRAELTLAREPRDDDRGEDAEHVSGTPSR